MTPRKAPEAVLVALAESTRVWLHCQPSIVPSDAVKHWLGEYKAATAPLRTRASVDAEIATSIRKAMLTGYVALHDDAGREVLIRGVSAKEFIDLCMEPTADETEARQYLEPANCHWCNKLAPITPHGWDNICAECFARGEKPNAVTDHGADMREAEACSCEEAEGLKRKLADIRTEWDLWRAEKKNGYAALVSIGSLLKD